MFGLVHYGSTDNGLLDHTAFFDGVDTNYRFDVYRLRSRVYGADSVYMLCAIEGGFYVPVYVGKASSMSDRLIGHDRLEEAERRGATRLLVHTPGFLDGVDYEEAERRLIRYYSPPLNAQARMPAPLQGG